MILYEVNLSVSEAVADAYEAWLREHVKEMLGFTGFQRAVIFVPEDEIPGKCRFTVHYYVATRADLENYLTHHATRMRQKGTSRFGEHLSATRRILTEQAAVQA